ncbi:hypothetical protein CDL15_Pgr020061 [Punica granatum]|uniref:G domain-containing protein n=1 Tax=Punica granatum TaxID=22663 RepID=A0A218VQG1_PUNGR|nr:hypothetical protein CDL15_Pgr020061 [Punica granatum]PKI76747.1 hypothetical protein CRG98_002733 [Punica granatum]
MGGEGGERASSDGSLSEGECFVDNEMPQLPPRLPSSLRSGEGGAEIKDGGLASGNSDESNRASPPGGLDFDVNWRRSQGAYREILKSYDDTRVCRESLAQAKSRILSYYPGAWIEEVGGTKSSEYDVPRTTCLILIGPKGSGKSSLINRISKVFEDDKFTSERAQVTFNSSAGDGTLFLREYMIPRRSTSFCLYDTRSWSLDALENAEMIRRWMLKGVRDGELVIWGSDDPDLRKRMKYKARQKGHPSSAIRAVNFVIFVVDGLSVLKSMEGKDDGACPYMDMVATMFNLPYQSFKDDRPVVVVTHGDLLSVTDRARIRVHLGERLGIPPAKQIFDIPESSDPLTEFTIIDMIHYSLEHADRNLPHKKIFFPKKVCRASTILRILYFSIVVGFAIISAFRHRAHHHRPRSNLNIDWPSMRHMWLA